MRPLPRALCLATPPDVNRVRFDVYPLQAGMAEQPYYVALASMLLCRSRRPQAERVLRDLLRVCPYPWDLARVSEVTLTNVVRPCGLHRNRARQMARFANQWLGDAWTDLRELTGVGAYVADAVGLFCFGYTDLECDDHVLRSYCDAGTPPGPAPVRDAQSPSPRTDGAPDAGVLPGREAG